MGIGDAVEELLLDALELTELLDELELLELLLDELPSLDVPPPLQPASSSVASNGISRVVIVFMSYPLCCDSIKSGGMQLAGEVA